MAGGTRSSHFRPIPRPTSDTVPTLKQYTDVIDRFNQLLVEYRELDRLTTAKQTRYRELKKALKDWEEYIHRKRLVPAEGQRHDAAEPVNPSIPAGGVLHVPVENITERSRSPVLPVHATLKTTSSQTTQGEPQSDKLNPHDEDDVPEVVSARSLRKNRLPAGRHFAGQQAGNDGTPARPLAIKEESMSSPSMAVPGPPPLMRTGTSDLDQIAVSGRSTSQLQKTLALSAHTQSNGTNHPGALVKTDPSVQGDENIESELPALTDLHAGQGSISTQSSGPLLPLSVNTPTPSRTGAVQGNSSGSRGKGRGARAIHLLSEDGSDSTRSSKKIKLSSDDEPARQFSKAKLSHLLEGGTDSPLKVMLSPVSNRQPRFHAVRLSDRIVEQQQIHQTRTPATKKSPTKTKSAVRPSHRPIEQQQIQQIRTPVPKKSPSKTNRLIMDDPGPILPEHEPLRSRPLHRLGIDDFKINPKYGGLGYAYSESIRKRDERRCLPGCTQDCCSAFRRMAALGLLPNEPQRRGLFDDPEAEVDEEELTLRGYLGQAYADTIRNASPEEKKQMLIEARTKAFADKHGKHRQVFERRTTPPGFWRTEMPTTQELEEDRQQARRQERQKVEERWREAMRGGGRFIFRDE